MLRIEKKTRKTGDEIITAATQHFGPHGFGLDEAARNPCCITFEGIGGYVTVTVKDEEKHRIADIETREFEYPVKQFLNKL
jgi:hypothetical protein